MQPADDLFLQLSEEKSVAVSTLLRTALDHLRESAFVVAVDGSHRLLWGNGEAERTFGYRRAELIGRCASVLYLDEGQFIDVDNRSIPLVSSGTPYRGRAWMRRKDGSCFPGDHVMTPLCPALGRKVAIWYVRDSSGERLAALREDILREGVRRLTRRERDVFICIAQGNSAKETARLLGISPRTVELHRARILDKYNVTSTAQLLSQLLLAASKAHGDGGDAS